MTRGGRIIKFIERYLVVPEGAHVGRPIKLRPWQKRILRGIYDTPTRRALISLGRKNGKTALIAMLVVVHVIGPEARRNGHIFSAAQSRDQAAIVFGLAAKMIRMSSLHEYVHVRDSAKQLQCSSTGVLYRALSADATTAYGLSPVFVVHDELGQVQGPRSELYDALETACGAQEDPLTIVISTQAPTDADLFSVLLDDARAVGNDALTKVFLYAADKDDDPWDKATWAKANPALGDFRSLKDVREMADRARRLPSFEASFRNLILNQRVAATNHFLSPSVWQACNGAPVSAVFKQRPCVAGLDLSSRLDLTALVLTAEDLAGIVHVRPYFWAPRDGVKERAHRDRVPYDVWAREGWLELTPGASIDYAYVARRLAELSSEVDLKSVRFDRWRIEDLKRELRAIGCQVELEPHGQGFKDMSPALERLEALAVDGRLRHGDHPVLTWCAANSVVTTDAAGNRKLDKSRTTGRIDGMVALAMAQAVKPVEEEAAPFPYHVRGIRTISLGATL